MERSKMKADQISSRGFSLIEVMIAVLVLATGMLALAALQTRVMRETVDARARSQVAVFAGELIERQRSMEYDDIPVGTVELASAADLSDLAARAGVSSFEESTVVAHYVANAGAFTRFTTEQVVEQNIAEFKQIEFSVTWTDASGAERTLDMVSAVSPITLDTSGNLISKNTSSAFASTRPVVRRETPEGAGIIPIALADGSETAATNPKPRLGGSKGETLVSDTRFEVLTYKEYTENSEALAKVQQRVETAVIGCTCSTTTTGFDSGLSTLLTARPFRPTFWTGTSYGAPEVAEYAVTTGPKSGVVQSELCDVCCRDHQDPAGVVEKFDPFRDSHDHYKISGSSLVAIGNSDTQYVEACRLIRVDGQFRVASDLGLEHMALIPTDNTAKSSSIAGATDEYESFALGYMRSRFTDGADGTNVPVASATAESLVAGAALNLPALLTLNPSAATTDLRYLHARGLYIDYLEEDARTEIGDAWDDCSLTGDDKIKCVLPFIPFSAVNLTEIASWVEATTGAVGDVEWLTVSNSTGTVFGDPDDPVRGRSQIDTAASIPSPVPGSFNENRAQPVAGLSNSTVARFNAIDPDDLADTVSDTQRFAVQAGSSTSPDGVDFSVMLSGHPKAGDGVADGTPVVSLAATMSVPECDAAGLSSSSYSCSSDGPSDVSVTLGTITYMTTTNTNASPKPCGGNQNKKQNQCNVYSVGSVAVSHEGVVVSPITLTGSGSSATYSFVLGTVADGDSVVVTFGAPTVSNATAVCDGTTFKNWTCP